MRLWKILLPSNQRPTKLLQQRYRPQSHCIFHWRVPITGSEYHYTLSNLRAYTGSCHRSIYWHTLRRDRCTQFGPVQEGETPDCSRRWYYWRPVWCNYSRSFECTAMDIQEGEAPEETQGALRGAVCPDHGVSANYRVKCGLSHG